jgi:hypothetical protein
MPINWLQDAEDRKQSGGLEMMEMMEMTPLA